jgi:hypothetical protein
VLVAHLASEMTAIGTPNMFEILVAGGEGGLHSMFLPTHGDSWPATVAVEP